MGLFSRKGPSGFSASSTAEEVTQGIDGTGLTAIVTGATSGIGLETSRVLALRGVHVVMAIRNMKAGNNVKESILKEIPNARVDVMELDLSSLASVRKFAAEYNSYGFPLNILINNAGVMTPFKLSQDNIELQFATNHLGHFLLTNLLLETMKRTSRESNREGRIVNLSSMCHQYSYREGIRFDKINDESSYYKHLAYGQSKLANILHANELTRRLKEEGVQITANSLHPGAIPTNIVRFDDGILHYIVKVLSVFIIPFIKTIQQGAATTCFVAVHPQVKGVSGEYFADCNIAKPGSQAKDADLATKLWDFSLTLTNANNNAGVIADTFKLSQGNIELDFATNHLGHFLLTNLLLETMKRTSRESNREGRIVNVSSVCHQNSYREGIRFDSINDKSRYRKYVAYIESKLANILHANELTRRLKEERVEIAANSLHPGIIRTNIIRNHIFVECLLKVLGLIFMTKTIQQGAATTCFLALHPQVKGVSGKYFVDCNIAKPSSQANDADLAKRLWDFSLSLTNNLKE